MTNSCSKCISLLIVQTIKLSFYIVSLNFCTLMTIIKFVKAEIKLQSICCWNVLFVWKQTWYKFWISRQLRSISPKVQTALESWAVPRSVHQVSSKVRGIETSQFAKKLPEHCNQSSFVVLVQSRWWLNHCST